MLVVIATQFKIALAGDLKIVTRLALNLIAGCLESELTVTCILRTENCNEIFPEVVKVFV